MLRKIDFGIALILLLMSTLMLAFNIQPVKASGTVYIRADGSVEGTTNILTTDNVTYTLNATINDWIVVERSNIIIDGDGYTLQGTGSGDGIYLSGRSNVTIKNMEIIAFSIGISLLGSSNNNIVGNNVTECKFGVWLGGLVAMNVLNNIVGNNMKNNDYAISVNGFSNYIAGNDIKNSIHGILIDGASNNMVGNHIATNEWHGIKLEDSYNNTIFGNMIGSSFRGICFYSSSNNTISCNSIWDGVMLHSSSNNLFYHNNFGDISQTFESVNIWDDGYPSGGNYWRYTWGGYIRVDEKSGPDQDQSGSDGICDAAYAIDGNNTDRYSLFAPITVFDVGTWNGIAYHVGVVSNSSVSDFYFNPDEGPFLKFNVTGWYDDTAGFCRVTVPEGLLWTDNGWTINVNNETITNYEEFSDVNNTYLYFTYNHSTEIVVIQGTNVIPEFSPTIILPLFMMIALIAITLTKKKQKQKTK